VGSGGIRSGDGSRISNIGSSDFGMGCFESAAVERAGGPGCIPAACTTELFGTPAARADAT
jgi:hypothetical protein